MVDMIVMWIDFLMSIETGGGWAGGDRVAETGLYGECVR